MRPDQILIVAALPEEISADQMYQVCYTGVGKVNAATRLSFYLSQLDHKPQLVVNLGSAGSAKYRKGAVVQIGHYHQHDFDLGPLAHLFPAPPIFNFKEGLTAQGLGDGLASLYTGDRFVNSANAFDVVDMEGYALASVCKAYGLPLASFKYITDGSDAEAHHDWQQELMNTEQVLLNNLQKWLSARAF